MPDDREDSGSGHECPDCGAPLEVLYDRPEYDPPVVTGWCSGDCSGSKSVAAADGRSAASEVTIVLFSIDPEWSDAILEGSKKFEYRRQPPARDPPYVVLLYATQPVGLVVGGARVDRVVQRPIDPLVENTIDDTPHVAGGVRDYLEGADQPAALHINRYERLQHPVPLSAIGIDRAPQNFLYLNREQLGELSGGLVDELTAPLSEEANPA